MDLARIDLNLLLAFEALLATRSVSRAAVRLGLRQPAMSAALGRLRTMTGDRLFERASGAMQPTPRALAMAPGIAAALAQLRETLGEALPFDPATATRVFTIASTDYTGFVLLSVLLARLAAAPTVALHVVGYEKNDVPAMIDRGEIDLALGVFDPPPERAVCTPLWEERLVGLARRGHPALAAGGMTLDDFAGTRHALVSVRRDARGRVDALLAELGLRRHIALVLPHMLALPAVLAGSDLVAAVPERVALHCAGDRLVMFELPIDNGSWHVDMLWNPVARADRASRWLRSEVMAAAQGLRQGGFAAVGLRGKALR